VTRELQAKIWNLLHGTLFEVDLPAVEDERAGAKLLLLLPGLLALIACRAGTPPPSFTVPRPGSCKLNPATHFWHPSPQHRPSAPPQRSQALHSTAHWATGVGAPVRSVATSIPSLLFRRQGTSARGHLWFRRPSLAPPRPIPRLSSKGDTGALPPGFSSAAYHVAGLSRLWWLRNDERSVFASAIKGAVRRHSLPPAGVPPRIDAGKLAASSCVSGKRAVTPGSSRRCPEAAVAPPAGDAGCTQTADGLLGIGLSMHAGRALPARLRLGPGGRSRSRPRRQLALPVRHRSCGCSSRQVMDHRSCAAER